MEINASNWSSSVINLQALNYRFSRYLRYALPISTVYPRVTLNLAYLSDDDPRQWKRQTPLYIGLHRGLRRPHNMVTFGSGLRGGESRSAGNTISFRAMGGILPNSGVTCLPYVEETSLLVCVGDDFVTFPVVL